eukprot:8762875-Lingulodinium_polyedra.AAC.1
MEAQVPGAGRPSAGAPRGGCGGPLARAITGPGQMDGGPRRHCGRAAPRGSDQVDGPLAQAEPGR